MRIAAVALALLTAAPAAAQVSVSTNNIPSAAGTAAFARGLNDSPQFRDNYIYGYEDVYETNLRRAGAWGECVATAAPADSREYLLRQRTTSLLRWSFERCQRKVGQFAGYGVINIRRAALLDALRAG